MNNLKLTIFVLPVIALILVGVLYILLSKRSSNKEAFRWFVLIISVLAFLFNIVWELAQAPLYKGYTGNLQHTAFCILASVSDAVMVLLIYFGFALIYKNLFWADNLTWQRISMIMIIGGIGAILIEVEHISSGSWAYAKTMPIIPIVKVGLFPVLQFMVLPVIIYRLSFYCLKNLNTPKKKMKSSNESKEGYE